MSLETLFEHIHAAYSASTQTLELAGRMLGLRWGIVTEVANDEDTIKLGMVKVKLPHQPNSTSNWLMRIVPWQGMSPPMPVVGDTVLVGYDDGNPNGFGFYVGIPNNLLNPAYNDPKVWRYQFSDDIYLEITSTYIKLVAFACIVTIDQYRIDFTAPQITWNSADITDTELMNNKMSMSGGNLDFNIPGKVKIHGKNIMVVGGKDSDNDTMTQDGQ